MGSKSFLTVILLMAALVRADAPPAVSSTRAAFLKLIDRPRVEPNVEEKEVPAPDGMVQTHVAISTDRRCCR